MALNESQGYSLLEENWTETGVEGTDTLVLQHLGETTNETVGVGWLRNETDTGGLEWAEGNVGEELSEGGGGQVDGSAVVGSVLVTNEVDGLLLEKLITSELEGTLEEVTGKGWTGTGQESTSTLIGDDLLEATDETSVVGGWVKLDSGLDAVMGSVSHWNSVGKTTLARGDIGRREFPRQGRQSCRRNRQRSSSRELTHQLG
jgi:hypothetical protein